MKFPGPFRLLPLFFGHHPIRSIVGFAKVFALGPGSLDNILLLVVSFANLPPFGLTVFTDGSIRIVVNTRESCNL